MTIDDLIASGREPRVHPNGFIQFDLDGDSSGPWTLGRRLHIWPKVPLPAQKSYHPIHDHAFSFQSEILLGRLTNITYEFYKKGGTGMFDLCRAEYRKTQDPAENTNLVYTGESGDVQVTSWAEVDKGQRYKLRNKIFHASVPDDGVLTATVMTKIETDINYRPLIAVPHGVTPDNNYRRDQIPSGQLWKIVDEVMYQIGGRIIP